MNRLCLIIVLLGSMLLSLSACTPTGGSAVEESLAAETVAAPTEEVVEVTAVPATDEPTSQPMEELPTATATAINPIVDSSPCEAEAGHAFHNEAAGFCFVYPENYCWLPGQDAWHNTFVSMASEDAETNRCPDEPLILHGDVVWVGIDVSSASGQSLADLQETMTEAIENFDLEVEEVILAGETAVQINNMPGQDIGRQITTVHNDQIYQLTFIPAAADRLYSEVMDSFQFLSAEAEMPNTGDTATSSACDAAAGQLFHSEEGGYCFVYPENYCWVPGQTATVNSFVDIEAADMETNRCPDEPLIFHGEVVWVTVNVEPANGQTLDALAATVTAGLEDFGLETEEVMLAGETAVQINNMPGQDISRELLTVHNDRYYRLTFVPASADYGERYTQMQDLYTQVVDSFQFLP